MKLILFVTSFLVLLIINGCKFLDEHPLFNKGPDSLLNMPVVEPEPEIIDTTDLVMEDALMDDVVVTQTGNDKYFMIVGSFQNQNFAESYAEKIQEMGYQSQIIESQTGLYRVSAKSYSNFKQGVGEINEFRASITTGAWLHVR